LAGLPHGTPSAQALTDLKTSFDLAKPVIDPKDFDAYLKKIAGEKGIDYSVLSAAFEGATPTVSSGQPAGSPSNG
jgi:hypothetical protein